MVAGMVAVVARGGSLHQAVELGIAAGTATVISPGSALCEADVVAEMLDIVRRTND
jgi:6-phosphofructokinase 2